MWSQIVMTIGLELLGLLVLLPTIVHLSYNGAKEFPETLSLSFIVLRCHCLTIHIYLCSCVISLLQWTVIILRMGLSY